MNETEIALRSTIGHSHQKLDSESSTNHSIVRLKYGDGRDIMLPSVHLGGCGFSSAHSDVRAEGEC